jgi:GTP-binding protein
LMVKNVSQLKNSLPENTSGRAVNLHMRKGEMLSMETKGERMIVKFNIPSRGIIDCAIVDCNSWWGYYAHRFIG